MKRSHWLYATVLIALCLTSCHVRTTAIKRGPIEVREQVLNPAMMCSSLWCNQKVYLEDCNLADADGNTLSEIVVKNGERVCFYNRSSCDITIKYSTDLFARSESYVTIAQDECTTLTVASDATDSYRIELICDCGSKGEGHTNPTVRIGGDDEEDGG